MNTELKARLATLSAAQRAQLLERIQGRARAPVGDYGTESPTTYPLYDMQRVIWAAQCLDPTSWAYNVGFLFELSTPYRANLLRNAVEAVVARHKVLRTIYLVNDRGPAQTVLEACNASVEDIDASALEPDALEQHIRAAYERPFDLSRGPVWRLTQLRRSQGDAVLLIVGHHLAFDLWSINIFMDELRVAYEAEKTGKPPQFEAPSSEYAQFVTEQQGRLKGAEQEREWRFWSEQFRDVPPTLSLPTDRPRTALPTYRGGAHCFSLSVESSAALAEFARREGKTLYATLLAAWGVLLQKYSGTRDLVIGTPVSNRSRAFARTIGCAINFLPLRVRLSEDESFSELLDRVFQTVLRALEHQAFPFGVLTSRLNLPRSRGRTALSQVGFCLEGNQLQGHAIGDFQPKATPLMFLAQQEGQFELYLEMAERLGVLHGALRYDSELFDRETVARLATVFQSLVTAILEAPQRPLHAFHFPELSAKQGMSSSQGAPSQAEQLDLHNQAIRALWKQRCAARRSGDAVSFLPKDCDSL